MPTATPRPAAVTVRQRPVFTDRDWAVFAVLGTVNVTVTFWAGRRIAEHLDWTSAVVVVPTLIALLSFEARWFSLPLMRVPEPIPPAPGLRVAVATTFVPGLESLAMLRRTVGALVAMEYPHETWVLDEGDAPEVRALCEEFGARYFTRQGIERYQQPSGPFASRTKHGNYNAWLDRVGYESYDVIVGFDPDHIPTPAFLTRTLGYLRDDRVGYVQAAQLYYNQSASLVARGAAEETYAYYSSVQMTSYGLGYPIVTGCHNVHRSAALHQVGGFAAHEADDLLITVHYRAAGWRGVYVPERLAAGITPVDWTGYLAQQRRWARSVLDVKLRLFPRVAGRIPRIERVVAALHGLCYLHGLSTAIGVGLLAVALAVGWQAEMVRVAVIPAVVLTPVLFACDLFRQRFFLDRRTEWGIHLRAAILKFAKWPHVLLALFDALATGPTSYTVTAKVRQQCRRVLLRGHGLAMAVIASGAGVGVVRGRPPGGPLAVVAVVFVAISALVIALEALPTPAPYDDALAAART